MKMLACPLRGHFLTKKEKTLAKKERKTPATLQRSGDADSNSAPGPEFFYE